MLRIVTFLGAFLYMYNFLTSVIFLEKVCDVGEEYRPGLKPEPTCDKFLPKIVDFTIIQDCFCREDHVRDKEGGQCILVSKCKDNKKPKKQADVTTCPDGEVWGSTPEVQPTCKHPEVTMIRTIDACHCVEGKIRNAEGQCILKEQCVKGKNNTKYNY